MEATKEIKTIQEQLYVARKELITPHYLRVYLTGENIYKFANTTVGVNNKIMIPPKGCTAIHFPTFDYEQMQWIQPPEEVRPFIRTYTHRGIDLEANEIWIDFVIHGENAEEGPASNWALTAQKGDVLGVLMKNGKSELYPFAEYYMLVGDATALPVLASILEDLPSEAKATCILEVYDKADEQIFSTRATVNYTWLHQKNHLGESRLSEEVKKLQLPEENRFAYVAAEFSAVKKIRHYLRKEKSWNRDELYAYSYWKSGVAEDKSVSERQKEKETI